MVHKTQHQIPFWHFLKSTQEVLKIPLYLIFFIFCSVVFYALLIAVPAKTIPGNSFTFQLSLLTIFDHLLLLFLSILTGLNLTFHTYLYKRKKSSFSAVKTVSGSLINIISGLIATIFGTATCGLCIATIFGYFGFGLVLFLLQWRLYIVGFAIILSLTSLYFLNRQVIGICKICKITK